VLFRSSKQQIFSVSQRQLVPQIVLRNKTNVIKESQVQEQIQLQRQGQINNQVFEQVVQQKQSQVQEQIQLQRQEQKQSQRNSLLNPQISNTFTPFNFNNSRSNIKSKRRFDLFVRKKGKFGLVQSGESVSDLFSRGKYITSNTATASFKILEGVNPINDFSIGTSDRYYKSTREPGVFVQKKTYRISSGGEKSEISQKGLLTLRNRKGIGGGMFK
jgi:hypothetical protein